MARTGVLALAAFAFGCEGGNLAERPAPARGTVVGTPASMFSMVRASRHPMATRRLTLQTETGEAVPVLTEGYETDGDYQAITGVAEESERSAFLLKGDGKNLYGWLVLHDRHLAFEYTTSPNGDVVAKEVPVTRILPDCNDGPAVPATASPAFEPPLGEPAADAPHVGAYDGVADPKKLQSRPSATKVLYLDLSVLGLSKADLYLAWQGVSSAYSAFDVNVTSDVAVYDATPVKNRGKACISNADGRSTCYVNIFGTSRCCDVYNKGNGNYQGLTLSHELGHMMGLDHDGTSTLEYATGFTAYRWVPLMGDCTPESSWGKQALYQWSKGEYTGANHTEDDLAIITKNLPYRPDDIPDSKALIINGSQVLATDNRGQIAHNTDSDTFTFTIGSGGGHAKLLVERTEVLGGGMLDVEAEIRNAGGTSLAKGNDKAARTANLDLDLPAGAYTLIVRGGAEGTPANGFSNYSSLGFYGISGTITGAVANAAQDGGVPPTNRDAGGLGGNTGSGGSTTGGVTATGGMVGAGGARTGGTRTGGMDSGVSSSGPDADRRDAGRDTSVPVATGGTRTGGTTATGGIMATGGVSAKGGAVASTGGVASGGSTSTGGSGATGGVAAGGGAMASGGTKPVGSPATGGAGGQGTSGSPKASTGCSCTLGQQSGPAPSAYAGMFVFLLVVRRLRRFWKKG